MTSPHGNALRMRLALSQLALPQPDLHVIPLLPETQTSHTNLLVTGIASTPTTDLQHIKFAARCFPLHEPWPPLLVRHDNSAIAGRILSLAYDHADRLLIHAELTHPLAKRMAAFSVGCSVGHFTCNKDEGATVHTGTLTEISVTDRPANPACLITHRHPQSAAVAYYTNAQQWVATFKQLAEVIAHQVVQASRPQPLVHPRKPPTDFARLVNQITTRGTQP